MTNLVVVSLDAISLRCLFYALSKLGTNGSVNLNVVDMAYIFQVKPTYVSKGIRRLIRFSLLSPKAYLHYWINPDIALPITTIEG